MDITKNTPFDEISKAFNFEDWEWDPDNSKTIKQICIESAAIAARDILTNQDLAITPEGVTVETYLDGQDVVKFLIPWSIVLRQCEGLESDYADILENVASTLRKRVSAAPDSCQRAG